MMSIALRCFNDHIFSAWFVDADSFIQQNRMKLVMCPQCGICDVQEDAFVVPEQNMQASIKTPSKSQEVTQDKVVEIVILPNPKDED
ncbi:MAG: DUF1178 family protein [Alphaproteobacteria bacterium]|nr:DUF1178 family protein [Alphaproteobacteria bacterium]